MQLLTKFISFVKEVYYFNFGAKRCLPHSPSLLPPTRSISDKSPFSSNGAIPCSSRTLQLPFNVSRAQLLGPIPGRGDRSGSGEAYRQEKRRLCFDIFRRKSVKRRPEVERQKWREGPPAFRQRDIATATFSGRPQSKKKSKMRHPK